MEIPLAFDAHNHLDFPAFDGDRQAVVARAHAAGINGWIIAGADPAHWGRIDAVAAQTGGVPCHGVHPWWILDLSDAAISQAIADLRTRPTSGIGETGLDWFRAEATQDRHRQESAFRAHIDIAIDRSLPLVLHCVRAYPRLLDILEESGEVTGMIHSWSGPPELIDRAISLGLYVSFGATLTRSAAVRRSAAAVPDDHLLLETDAPDQAIQRDVRGEPLHLVQIAARMAALRKTDVTELLALTEVNAIRLFGLSP